jgi:hypothetical protein
VPFLHKQARVWPPAPCRAFFSSTCPIPCPLPPPSCHPFDSYRQRPLRLATHHPPHSCSWGCPGFHFFTPPPLPSHLPFFPPTVHHPPALPILPGARPQQLTSAPIPALRRYRLFRRVLRPPSDRFPHWYAPLCMHAFLPPVLIHRRLRALCHIAPMLPPALLRASRRLPFYLSPRPASTSAATNSLPSLSSACHPRHAPGWPPNE